MAPPAAADAAAAPQLAASKDLTTDPRYKQGVALMEDGKFEEAADHFSELLQIKAETLGEMDRCLAPLYFQYGSAILAQAEQGSGDSAAFEAALAKAASKAAVGGGGGSASAADAEADGAAAAQAIVNMAATKAREAGDSSAAPDAAAAAVDGMKAKIAALMAEEQATRDAEDEDLELAWQNLDVARALYAADPAPTRAARLALARAHDRLADLHAVNGNDPGVVEELEAEVLALEAAPLPPTCEHVADVRLRLTLAYCACVAAPGVAAADAARLRGMALQQGAAARAAFAAVAARLEAALSNGGSGSGEAAADGEDAALPLRMRECDGGGSADDKRAVLERIHCTLNDVDQLAASITEELKAAEAEGVTTVGFGAEGDGGGGGSAAAVQQPAAATAAVAPAPVTVLAVKRKKPAAAAAAAAADGAPAAKAAKMENGSAAAAAAKPAVGDGAADAASSCCEAARGQ